MKRGTIYRERQFHNDTGAAEDPTAPEAQLRKPDGSWVDLGAPTKSNGQTGLYGVSLDMSDVDDYPAGDYALRIAGTVTVDKSVGTVFEFELAENSLDDLMTRLTAVGVSLTTPVDAEGETITIDCGDEYAAADGRSIDLTVTGASDFTAGTVALKIGRFLIAGTILSSGPNASQVVRFEPTAAQTARLNPSTRRWKLKVVLANGHPISPASGPCHVHAA